MSRPKLVINVIQRRPRMVGGLVTATLFWILLINKSIDSVTSGFIAVAWLLGLAIGGNYPQFFSFSQVLRRRSKTRIIKSWTSAFWVSLIGTCLVTLMVIGIDPLPGVVGALALPYALCYGICKVACWKFGCCGYAQKAGGKSGFRDVPLQLVEAAGSFVVAIAIVLLLWMGGRPEGVFGFFFLTHTVQRIWSTRQRRRI